MSHYKPYPEYKDSGVEWIGEVPAHWEVKRLGHVGDIFKGSGGNKSDQTEEGVPCLRYGEIYTRYDSFLEKPVNYVSTESASVYTPLHPGDVVFTASGEDVSEIGKAVAVMFDGPLVCGGDTIILRPRWHANHSIKFLGYLANAAPIAAQKSVSGTGFTVVHISGGKIKEVRLAWPQSGEQSQIATFLDRETTRIDTLIEKKQRFIELLEEKRQAVITQAVTKGLDPNAPMKDSGVEWIGEVPAPWGDTKLVRVFKEKGKDLTTQYPPGAISFGEVVTKEMRNEETLASYQALEEGEFIVNPLNLNYDLKSLRVALSDKDVRVSSGYIILRLRDGFQPRYVRWLMYLFDTRYMKTLGGGIRQTITFADIAKCHAAIPGSTEQSQIATFLDCETTRIDTLIEKTRESIELLKERRSALITAAVTGKIDVREEAA